MDRRTIQKDLLIELSSHSHVIEPWNTALDGFNKEIVVPKVVHGRISKYLEEQSISQKLLVFDSFEFTMILIKKLLYKVESKSRLTDNFDIKPGKIILTSAPEMRMTVKCSLNMLLLSFVGVDVLCIRNAGRWELRKRDIGSLIHYSFNPLKIAKAVFLEVISYLIEQSIYKHSKKLVFESRDQMQTFNRGHRTSMMKPQLVFCGRQPRQSIGNLTYSKSNAIGIGLLGTINKEKRNYKEVSDAVKLLADVCVPVRVYFLGAYLGPHSQEILDIFGSSVEFAPSPSERFVSEHSIAEIIDEIDVFVSPMTGSHYQNGGSSGAVGDSVFWQKPLLIPSRFKSKYDHEIQFTYESAEELAGILKVKDNLHYSEINQVTTSTLREFVSRLVSF
jgi:hypothetical protein